LFLSIQSLTQDILNIAGNFSIWLILALFLLCFINEFGLSIPYLMETVWILAGYNTLSGQMALYQLFLLWTAAVAGRISGAGVLYSVLGLGRTWLHRIYEKIFGAFLSPDNTRNHSLPVRLLHRINLFSPFSVALGRLLWLKIPMTLLLTVRKQYRTLMSAIVLSSLIWDFTYVIVGVIGGNTKLQPGWFVLYSLGALTLIYGTLYLIKRIFNPKNSNPSG
jgi:membrane-associated protein